MRCFLRMKILYICTHNRCRSILCEALTQALNSPYLEARSAGSLPAGEVHPLTLKYLAEQGIATEKLTSQSWDDFADYDADLVITVCDSAAGETCPIFFGKALKIHWGLADPSKVEGSEQEKANAFRETISTIKERVNALNTLAQQSLTNAQITQALIKLGAKA